MKFINLDMDVDGQVFSDYSKRILRVYNTATKTWREYSPSETSSSLNPTICLFHHNDHHFDALGTT